MLTKEPLHAYLKSMADPKKIHDNPLNKSPTKMLYSFPSTKRFTSQLPTVTKNAPFYNVTGVNIKKVTRACTLGKGSKYDFTKNQKNTPAPNVYFPKNLSIGVNEKKGFSFGVSRDLAPQQGIMYASKYGSTKPGPGAYTPVVPKSQVTVTFRIKTSSKKIVNENIGPGKYEFCPSFDPCKKIINSKFKNTKNTKFPPLRNTSLQKLNSPMKSSNDKLLNGDILTCDMNHQINKQGVFFNSKYHNSNCRSFSKAERERKDKMFNTPGPGSYLMPSEFGFYCSSKCV